MCFVFLFQPSLPVSKVNATGTCKHRAVEASQMPPDLESVLHSPILWICKEGLFFGTRSGKSNREAPLVEHIMSQEQLLYIFWGAAGNE